MNTLSQKINRRVQGLQASSTLTITARAKELKAQGCDVVNFAAGEPDFDTPLAIKESAIRAIQAGFTKYTPSIGALELRQAICAKFKKENGLDYSPAQIVVSCGAKHSLFNIIQVLADEGDEVLIPVPYWVSYPEMVKFAGATPKFIPTSEEKGFKITPQQLSSAINERSRLLILNSPSNPTGAVYTRDELQAIAALVVEHDIMVISDEIYEKLIYGDGPYTSIAALNQDVARLTITVNGVSKAYSMTGWRIGYCAGPPEIMSYIKKVQDHSTSNPCSISQQAARQALESPATEVMQMRDEFRQRRDLLMAGIDEIPGISYIPPQGAFYLFCNVSQLGDAFTVAQRILDEKHVAMIPGEGFGAPGFVRLSFATSADRIKEGTRRLAEWVRENQG